ncbi:MAG: PQQ-binding-like beta-propeller repeat protein, partial [Planctomycetia bacterium]
MNFILATVLAAATVGADRWTGFLGAGVRDFPADAVPETWSPSENIAWKAPAPGHGQSSPVVWKDRIFLTAVEGPMKDACLLLCYDLNDGRRLWSVSVPTSDPVKDSYFVSRAAPTPVVDADRVVAFFESGDVVCCGHDGVERWRRSFSEEFGRFQNKFGLAASPAQTDDAVYFLIDDAGP